MKTSMRLLVLAVSLALIAFVSGANAMPLSGAKGPAEAGSNVIKVHGCHRSCEWGRVLRWHRHVGPACRPIGCYPRAAFPNRCWVDAWGVRHCRW